MIHRSPLLLLCCAASVASANPTELPIRGSDSARGAFVGVLRFEPGATPGDYQLEREVTYADGLEELLAGNVRSRVAGPGSLRLAGKVWWRPVPRHGVTDFLKPAPSGQRASRSAYIELTWDETHAFLEGSSVSNPLGGSSTSTFSSGARPVLPTAIPAEPRRTIVLVHGAWMTPSCWDRFRTYYEDFGYRVLAPAWPHNEGSVAELRARGLENAALAASGIPEILAHYRQVIAAIEPAPILIGHSFGGLFVQQLLAEGYGAAGVAIDSAPPFTVLPGGATLRANAPALAGQALETLRSWRDQRDELPLTLSLDQFRRDWVHTWSGTPERQAAAYDAYVVPTAGRIFKQALTPAAAVAPGRTAPLLLIAGGEDRTVTPDTNLRNLALYAETPGETGFRTFPGRTHWIVGQEGWEEVARYAIEWVERRLPATSRPNRVALPEELGD